MANFASSCSLPISPTSQSLCPSLRGGQAHTRSPSCGPLHSTSLRSLHHPGSEHPGPSPAVQAQGREPALAMKQQSRLWGLRPQTTQHSTRSTGQHLVTRSAKDASTTSSSSAPAATQSPGDTSEFVARTSQPEGDWFARNAELLRSLPLIAGPAGGVSILLNRILSDIPAVADAGSSQTRADVLGLVLSAALTLTGLQWLSLKPRDIPQVPLDGVPCFRTLDLPSQAKQELTWLWESLSSVTCCRSLVVVYRGSLVLQAGLMAPSSSAPEEAEAVDVARLWRSSLVVSTRNSRRANYLANLALFPARFDLLQFLPHNTQSAILLPLGEDEGLLVAGGDMVRGFTPLDQSWILCVGEKLDSTLDASVKEPSVSLG